MTLSERNNRGSVLLLAVGLLTILAMLGGTFLLVARMNQRTSRAISDSASIEPVAHGVLEVLVNNRLDDLHIDNNNNVVYARGIDYGEEEDILKTVDYPTSANYDRALASIEPYDSGGGNYLWRRLSNIGGPVYDTLVEDISITDPRNSYVDTDNDGVKDALLVDWGVTDRHGQPYRVAVRMIDAAGLINANTAYAPIPANQAPMPATNVSLWQWLVNYYVEQKLSQADAETTANKVFDAIHIARSNPSAPPTAFAWERDYVRQADNRGEIAGLDFLPFDSSDMLAAVWKRPEPGKIIPTLSGRLFSALDIPNNPILAGLTTRSASRVRLPVPILGGNLYHKFDLDYTGPTKEGTLNYLFAGFFNALPNSLFMLDQRRVTAAQLAVNVYDYRDDNDTPTQFEVPDIPGTSVYGVERQPFITEAGYKIEPSDPPTYHYGIEIYNPYTTPIDITGWKVQSGLNDYILTNFIPIGGRLVIASDDTVKCDPSASLEEFTSLDLSAGIKLLRPADNGTMIIVDEVGPSDLAIDPLIPQAVICRDDTSDRAVYSLQMYQVTPITNIDITLDNTLGQANGQQTLQNNDFIKPHPIYVRNGNFINVGELARIFYIGPDTDRSLPNKLTYGDPDLPAFYAGPRYTHLANGRFPVYKGTSFGGAEDTVPEDPWAKVPVGAIFSEYFMVKSPLHDGVDNDGDGVIDGESDEILHGLVNINTATRATLAALPAFAAFKDKDQQVVRNEIIDAIIAYRDSPDPDTRQQMNLNKLREEAGFAFAGEFAIPLLKAFYDKGLCPRMYGPNPPDAYSLSGGDDGLSNSQDDLTKYEMPYAWVSNLITVRSDVFIAYIYVQEGDDASTTRRYRRYVAMIDRSRVPTKTSKPAVVFFSEMR